MATRVGQVMVESSDKMWSTREGNVKTTSAFLPWEPPEQYEKAKGKKMWHWQMNFSGQ